MVLDVPLVDLLKEDEGSLSAPILMRAQLVRLMKTVTAMREKCDNNSMRPYDRNARKPAPRNHARAPRCRPLAHRGSTPDAR